MTNPPNSGPMTVLMTTDTVGGVWTYSLELVEALAPHGVRVVLATMGPPPAPAQRRALEGSSVAETFDLGQPLEWMEDPWDGVDAAGDLLLQLEARVAPDIVHLNGYVHATLGWTAPTIVVAHSDVLSWWRAVNGVAAPPSWQEYARRVGAGLAAADVVVAPTHAVLDDLRREFAGCIGAGRDRVIANGRRGSFRSSGPKEPFVLSAGRLWDAAKNVQAIDAVAPLLDWPVFVAGDEAPSTVVDPDRLPAVRLGLLPFDELAGWLSRAAIYASPARYEPFGLTALEAAMCECALVLGDIPSLREVWGDAACFVPPDDHTALRFALGELAGDPRRRAEMGRHACERASSYSAARMGDAYAALYGSLVGDTMGSR